MPGTDISIYDDLFASGQLENMWTLASRISKTSFVPDVFRNKPEEVMAAWLAGREVGIGPMMALQKINVIKGKPTQAAELMRALVESQGHEIWTEDYSTTRVILCGRRSGQEHVNKVTWTLDDAKRANLAGKENWRQYPRAMLLARATGELCRLMFADVLGGISYAPEEIEDGVDFGQVAELPASEETVEKPPAATRKAPPARKAVAKKSAAPARSAAPPAPPLPGEDEPQDEFEVGDAEKPIDGEPEAVVKKRSQAIGMACANAALSDDDRHHLIAAVTNGRVASSKLVTAEEGAGVLQAVHEIAAGRKSLIEGDEGWCVVDVEDSTVDDVGDEDGDGSDGFEWGTEAQWDGDRWREFLKRWNVSVTDTIKRAQAEHRQMEAPDGEKPPGTLDQLHGRERLCQLVRGWVEEQAEALS